MIKSLKIKNFQSHKNSELDFHKGLNIISGSSGKGKTGLLRALKFNLQNNPSNESIHSFWNTDTSTFVNIDNHTIERTKTKSKNYYKLDDETFTAIGRNVPEEIESIINMNNTNIQNQHDSHFLFSDTPGNVAKHFNKIANIDLIDVVTKNVKSGKTQVKRKIENLKENIKATKLELDRFKDLEYLEDQLEVLRNKENEFKSNQTTIKQIKSTIERMGELESKIKLLPKLNKVYGTIVELLDILTKSNQITVKQTKIKGVLTQIENTVSNIDSKSKKAKLDTLVEKLILSRKNSRELTEILEKGSKLLDSIKNKEFNIKEAKSKIEKLKNQVNKIVGSICPICGNEIKELK
jgi:DNA repair exonuclease SbcCD ATPase subunit